MELNFKEISDEVYNENQPLKYWDINSNNDNQSKNLKAKKKKKVSFDDILSNMNLVVNKNGTLQHMSSNQDAITFQSEYTQQQVQKMEPIDPNVKHSYIYNKYFKDYHDANSNHLPEIRVPKSMEEYKKMLFDDKMKAIEQRKRLSEIKSKKLLFTNNISSQRGIATSNNNNLRSMKFF